MGIYDRDYYRDDEHHWGQRNFLGNMSAVAFLIIINVVLFLANMFFSPDNNIVTGILAMHSWTMSHPLYWFEFLTYGFVHSPNNLWHLVGNMFVLFFFGPPIERKYGKLEFFLFYILAILAGGIIWGILNSGLLSSQTVPSGAVMLGASGAVTALVILFAVNYPNAQVFLFGIMPLPAWVCGIMYVLFDAVGASHGTDGIAHEVHLAGAGFAALYFFSHIRLTRFWNQLKNLKKTKAAKYEYKSPKYEYKEFKTWRKEEEPAAPKVDRLAEEVDRILRKISDSGESSLTDHERATLRRASREYQKRNRE